MNQVGDRREGFTTDEIEGEYLLDGDVRRIHFWGVFCPKCGKPQIVRARITRYKCKNGNCERFIRVQFKHRHITSRVRGFFLTFDDAQVWYEKQSKIWAMTLIEVDLQSKGEDVLDLHPLQT